MSPVSWGHPPIIQATESYLDKRNQYSAEKYMLISMPQQTSSNFGAVQSIVIISHSLNHKGIRE